MTVQELINKLQQFDPTLPIVLSGYEGGVYLPEHVNIVLMAENVNDAWYYGPHEIVWPDINEFTDYKKFHGVYIK